MVRNHVVKWRRSQQPAMRVGFYARAARETDPKSVVTSSSDVSRVESNLPWSSGDAHGEVRSSAAIPDVEMRPEIETRQESEMDNPVEIQVSMSAICDGGSGTTISPKPLQNR